jgi:hypothetical protein
MCHQGDMRRIKRLVEPPVKLKECSQFVLAYRLRHPTCTVRSVRAVDVQVPRNHDPPLTRFEHEVVLEEGAWWWLIEPHPGDPRDKPSGVLRRDGHDGPRPTSRLPRVPDRGHPSDNHAVEVVVERRSRPDHVFEGGRRRRRSRTRSAGGMGRGEQRRCRKRDDQGTSHLSQTLAAGREFRHSGSRWPDGVRALVAFVLERDVHA